MLFLTRRVARVAPAYFLCLTALIVVNRLWQEDDWLRNALLHYAFAFNYFDATIFSINPPFWTIAVEMQFYLMLPLIFWVCGRLRPAQAALCITALAFLAYAAHLQISASAFKDVALGGQISPVVSYSLLAHLPHFLFGVVAGWLVNSWQAPCWSPTERTVPLLEAALWCAIVLLFVIMATPLDELLQVPYGRYNLPYVPLLFCVLIVLTPFTATGWLLLQHTPLRAVGSVSYGVYLYHLPVLHVVSRWMARAGQNPHDDWLMFSMTSLMVTLAAATLSYHFFEKPILGLIARRQVLIQARRCNP
jgi:peptidoglycan/LPS O-acetylase OafA/YrhL